MLIQSTRLATRLIPDYKNAKLKLDAAFYLLVKSSLHFLEHVEETIEAFGSISKSTTAA
jgi:hypothetical protein